MTKQPAATPSTTTRTRDPEVQPASVRPSWTAAQKLALLAEYEAFPHGSAERGPSSGATACNGRGQPALLVGQGHHAVQAIAL
jgi:hypothetical protein